MRNVVEGGDIDIDRKCFGFRRGRAFARVGHAEGERAGAVEVCVRREVQGVSVDVHHGHAARCTVGREDEQVFIDCFLIADAVAKIDR